ncbi:MAG: hypothetical protein U0638_13815 [Phycisphaerales bacterium]
MAHAVGAMRLHQFGAVVVLTICAHATAQWRVIDLHPEGAVRSRANSVAGGMQGGSIWITGIGNQAVMWSGDSNGVNLHPYSSGSSLVLGVCGDGTQVGVASNGQVGDDGSSSGLAVPSLWRGTRASWVNLRPAHATSGVAMCVIAGQQAGFSFYASPQLKLVGQHASLWRGSAASHVDLHPRDASGTWLVMNSFVNGISPDQEVGGTVSGPNQPSHAAMWRGSGTSWIDLHPAGATESTAKGAGAGTQVGWARFEGESRAGIWSGSAGSWRGIHPVGADGSVARAVFGSWQAGEASFGGVTHAGLWAGSAESWQDLHSFLGSSFAASSAASVWGDGAYLYVAGTGVLASDSAVSHALLWVRCRLDFDRNGFVNGDDFDAYGEAFDNAEPIADFNGDGFVNGDDWDEFSGAFDQGCD